MKLNVIPEQFVDLLKKGISLDSVYLLKAIDQQYDISLLLQSAKIKALHQGLLRKNFISKDNILTLQGEEVLSFVGGKITSFPKKENSVGDFLLWWEIFPGNNHFAINGRTFLATRSFKVKKEDCRIKFHSIISEGEYTALQIIEATKYDIHCRKKESERKKENLLTYLQNTLTYLNQRSFEGFIGMKVEEDLNTEEFDGVNI